MKLKELDQKINASDTAISVKRGIIESLTGLITYLALKYGIQVDEALAFTAATFIVTAVYKYIRRKESRKLVKKKKK
jgi:hypothetical protein